MYVLSGQSALATNWFHRDKLTSVHLNPNTCSATCIGLLHGVVLIFVDKAIGGRPWTCCKGQIAPPNLIQLFT